MAKHFLVLKENASKPSSSFCIEEQMTGKIMETELTFNGKGSVTILVFVYRVIISAVLWECKFSHYIAFECDVFSLGIRDCCA